MYDSLTGNTLASEVIHEGYGMELTPDERTLPTPRLILVAGMPATGKSTLAEMIAVALDWPLFTKDRFKELLFEAGGYDPATFDRARSRMIGAQSVELLKSVATTLLGVGMNVILESNFLPELAAHGLSPILGNAQVRQVYCTVAPELFLARYEARIAANQRHPVHVDRMALPELAERVGTDLHGPIPVDVPLLTVDTTEGYDPSVEEIVAFCRS